MNKKKYWFEIHHTQFADGTPEHPLVSFSIEHDEINKLFEETYCWEVQDGFEYAEIKPTCLEPQAREQFKDMMLRRGIIGSIWVSYYIKGEEVD